MSYELRIRPVGRTESGRGQERDWDRAFEADLRQRLGDGPDSAVLLERQGDQVVVSVAREDIRRAGPAVLRAAQDNGLIVLDPQQGNRTIPANFNAWGDVEAHARQAATDQASSLRAALSSGAGSPDEAMTRFVAGLGYRPDEVLRHTIEPDGHPFLMLPVQGALADFDRTVKDLDHPRGERRAMAAFRLGGHPASEQTIEKLRALLSSDPDPAVRSNAGLSLAVMGDIDSFDQLGVLLTNLPRLTSDPELTQAMTNAAHGLVILARRDSFLVPAAASALANASSDAPPGLRARLSLLQEQLSSP